ncbi:MAG: hypothetical protein Alis3KO_13160 [Aliiglaciecola sp.]
MRKLALAIILAQFLLMGCQSTTNSVKSTLSNVFSIGGDQESGNITDKACMTLVEEPSWFKDGFSFMSSGKKIVKRSIWAATSPSLDEMKAELKDNIVFLPWAMETEIGQYIIDSKKADSNIILDKEASRSNRRLYKKAEKVFNKVLANIPEDIAQEYDFKIYVIDNGKGQYNAHAIPGGVVLVTNYAVAQSSEDALTLMLSHEIAHVFKRHTVIRFQNTLIDSIETTEAMKELMSSKAKARIFATIDQILENGKAIISYPRKNEDEADLCGLSHMYQVAGTNSDDGINQFIAQIEKNTASEENEPKYPWTLHAHREPKDRKVYLETSRKIIATAIDSKKLEAP